MRLLIDDFRTMTEVDHTARTARDGQEFLKKNYVTHLYIDHDLGGLITGYDIINWALYVDLCPPNVMILSDNPVGRDNIVRALVNHGYERKGHWYRENILCD